MQRFSSQSFGRPRSRLPRRVYLPVLVGLFSMVVSLAATIFVRQGRLQAESKAEIPVQKVVAEKPMSRVSVIMPRHEIAAGTTLTQDMFDVVQLPANEVRADSFHSVAEIQGFYAKALLLPGQVMTRDYLTPVKPSSEVIGEIPEGFRAVSIRVDERTSVEGWARAGARVDVVWSSKVNGEPMISVIVENAKILSAERQVNPQQNVKADKPTPIPTTVTLLVAADDANRIQLASVSGSMSLSLRGNNDSKTTRAVPITVEDLLASGKPAAPTDRPRVVLSVRGKQGDRVSYAYDKGQLVAVPE